MIKQTPYTDYDKWFDEYKPVINHFHNDENESFNGRFFETYGQEDEYITRMAQEKPLHVWTMMDIDGFLIIVNGWHYVDRFGYMITEKPYTEGEDFSIVFEEDLQKLKRRDARRMKRLLKGRN